MSPRPARPSARGRALRWLAAATVACAVGAPPAAVAKDDPYLKELTRHAAALKSGSFHRRSAAWLALADTHDPRALGYLVAEYGRAAREPQVRAFLASAACDAFGGVTDLAALRAWRDAQADAADAWLGYRVALREVEHGAAADVLARVRDPRLAPALRGAALLALAAWADPSVLDGITAVLDAAPAAEPQRGLLLECGARALRSQAGRWGSPPYVRVALRLTDLVADPKVPDRTRLLVGRVFAHAAGLPRPLRAVAGWRLLLEGETAPSTDDEGRRYAPPVVFMDVVTTGHRIGFVVDASDSMSARLTPKELADLRPADPPAGPPARTPRGPRPGDGKHGPDEPRGRDGGRGPAPGLPTSSADGLIDVGLRWDRVRTRYDAALEFVRAAVARLGEDVRFAAVLFGTRADDLVRGEGLVPATRPRLAAMTKVVDVRLAGSDTRGTTNLHGGITRMFRTDESGFRPAATALDPVLLRDGVDTLYVLSDGGPSADDWDDGTERPGHDDRGTYYDGTQLLDDVDRWNLFRHAEIHVVSLGAYGGPLLEQLAWRHGGVFRRIPRVDGSLDDGPIARPSRDALEARLARVPPDLRERLRRRLGDPAPTNADPTPAPAVDDPAVLVLALASDDADERRRAARRLDHLAGRRWGFAAEMRPHERTALLRNWAWWLELHPPRPPAAAPPAGSPNAPGAK